MTSRYRDFDAFDAEQKGEPIVFKLGGREWQATHVNAATFLTLARRQADGGTNEALFGFQEYLASILDAGQRDDFDAMLAESDVQLGTLKALGEWIVAQATGAPFDAASSSPPAPSPTGRRPRVVSLDGAVRRTRRSAAG